MRVHDVARRDVCRWIARCPRLAGAIDAGLLGRHQQKRDSVIHGDASPPCGLSRCDEKPIVNSLILGIKYDFQYRYT
jgi:hypothetical protein